MSLPYDKAVARNMCFSKRAYPNEKFAKEVARSVLKKRAVVLRVYRCPECFFYHLTKQVVA